MSSASQAVLLSWSVPPAASFALALTAVVYLRGWFLMRWARVPFVPAWRAICFLLGLITLWVALASPLDTLSSFIITAHMLQHMLLMMLAPPLILLGAPLIPLVRGLPIFAAREFAGSFLNWRPAQRIGSALTRLPVALIVMGVATFAWHTPRLYELALSSSSWHELEHACFFIASLIFWWPVVQPWPSQPQAPRWAIVPYLLIADLLNTTLSAILVFADRVLYPSYAAMPRLFGFSALHDQAASGAIMWVMGSMAFLVPAVIIAVQCLSGKTVVLKFQPIQRADNSPINWLARLFSLVPGGIRRRFGARKLEAITFVVLFTVAGLCLAALASRDSDDDNQVLRMRGTSGPFAIAVFAAPGELPAGSNTVAVLVQDRNTQEALQDAGVDMFAQQKDGAQPTWVARASAEDSENKFLQSADIELPSEGNWSLSVRVKRGLDTAEWTLPLQVVKADSGFALPWAYITFLVLAVVLGLAFLGHHRAGRAMAARDFTAVILGGNKPLT